MRIKVYRKRIADGENQMSKYSKDKEHMDEIAERLSEHQDIWQDRYIYWIAVALGHILEWITRRQNDERK
jgi:hypothetical protein